MEVILLLGRLLLAGVFLVASFAKLADRAQFRQTLVDFGIPQFLSNPLSLLLPFAELAIGVALISVATASWGAIGALVLLAVFTVGIGVNLAQGKRPDCNCFGQLHASPIGISTLMRNGLLAGLAGFIVLAGWDNPGLSVTEWMAGLTSFQVIGFAVGAIVLGLFAIGGWLLMNLWHQQGRLLLRLEALEEKLGVSAQSGEQAPRGLPVGTQAPAFSLADLNGKTHTLKSLLELGKPTLLIFTDVNCGPCTALMPDIAHWQKEYANTLTIAPISRGGRKANRAKAKEFGVRTILLQKDDEVAKAYQCWGTPGAVVIRADGTLGSPIAEGARAIKAQVARIIGRPTILISAAKVGEPAPPIKLPDLAGKTITLADFKDTATVLLFWDPDCGFCERMLDDLKRWERDQPKDAPKLLVVSTGTVAQNRAMGLRSPVVLDQGFSTGQAYGAAGTPSAALISKEGIVASQVAVGAPAVLELLTRQSQTTQPVGIEQATGV